jgi:hypothetical protein
MMAAMIRSLNRLTARHYGDATSVPHMPLITAERIQQFFERYKTLTGKVM